MIEPPATTGVRPRQVTTASSRLLAVAFLGASVGVVALLMQVVVAPYFAKPSPLPPPARGGW